MSLNFARKLSRLIKTFVNVLHGVSLLILDNEACQAKLKTTVKLLYELGHYLIICITTEPAFGYREIGSFPGLISGIFWCNNKLTF